MNGVDAWGFATDRPGTAQDGPPRTPGTAAERGHALPTTTAPHTARRATTRPWPAPDGTDHEPQRTARAALTRILEPGDETAGRWVREMGPVALWRALSGQDARPPRGASPAKTEGLRLRAARARPAADLDAVAALGGRFICPGDDEWPGQLDDLGDARPLGLWVRGTANLRLWALRSVAVVGARACTDYGAHLATTLSADLADRGWTIVSGAACVLYPVTVVVRARCIPHGGFRTECPVLATA